MTHQILSSFWKDFAISDTSAITSIDFNNCSTCIFNMMLFFYTINAQGFWDTGMKKVSPRTRSLEHGYVLDCWETWMSSVPFRGKCNSTFTHKKMTNPKNRCVDKDIFCHLIYLKTLWRLAEKWCHTFFNIYSEFSRTDFTQTFIEIYKLNFNVTIWLSFFPSQPVFKFVITEGQKDKTQKLYFLDSARSKTCWFFKISCWLF